MVELKPGVSLRGIQPQMAIAAQIMEALLWDRWGFPCVITSGSEGHHMEASLHYRGLALDFRLQGDSGQQEIITGQIANALGAEFDVVYEPVAGGKYGGPCWHVEWDPKSPPSLR